MEVCASGPLGMVSTAAGKYPVGLRQVRMVQREAVPGGVGKEQ